jgi:hypothetical protein
MIFCPSILGQANKDWTHCNCESKNKHHFPPLSFLSYVFHHSDTKATNTHTFPHTAEPTANDTDVRVQSPRPFRKRKLCGAIHTPGSLVGSGWDFSSYFCFSSSSSLFCVPHFLISSSS